MDGFHVYKLCVLCSEFVRFFREIAVEINNFFEIQLKCVAWWTQRLDELKFVWTEEKNFRENKPCRFYFFFRFTFLRGNGKFIIYKQFHLFFSWFPWKIFNWIKSSFRLASEETWNFSSCGKLNKQEKKFSTYLRLFLNALSISRKTCSVYSLFTAFRYLLRLCFA